MASLAPPEPTLCGIYPWRVEYDGHWVGHASLEVDPGQHSARYTAGLFVAALRGRGLGRQIARACVRAVTGGRPAAPVVTRAKTTVPSDRG